MIFDTSLFEENDPALAQEVKKISIYFKGIKNMRLSWIDAKHLVKNALVIIQEINALATTKEAKYKDCPKVFKAIKDRLNEANNLNRFMRVIKAGNTLYNNKIQVIP